MDGISSYEHPEQDRLYRSDFMEKLDDREPDGNVVVHYGLIASGNSVMKDAIKRDQYAKDPDLEILCFEMEAGGLMNALPCLVIRGICDCSDSHKNDHWHNYAALAAAAYSRELLLQLKPAKVAGMPKWAAKLESSIREINEDVKRLKKIDSDEKIHRWLLAPGPSLNQKEAYEKWHPTTGSWFIGGKRFADWKTKPDSFLWLHGIPGCGKTILTSAIIEDVLHYCHQNPTLAVAYFYFSFNDSEKQQERQPMAGELPTTLRQMIQEFNGTFLILDASDECKERIELLENIKEIIEWELGKLHILATSRAEKDIEERLKPLINDQEKICIQDVLVNDDVCIEMLKTSQREDYCFDR